MFKKIMILGVSAVLLGGCTVVDIFKTNNAAEDQKTAVATASPVPTSSPDSYLQAIPSTSSSNDVGSLEADINNTKIIDEDMSDLN